MAASRTGAYRLVSCKKVHYLDDGLATALLRVFGAKSSVLELGAGCGCYSHFWEKNGLRQTSFDGTYNIADLTGGRVRATTSENRRTCTLFEGFSETSSQFFVLKIVAYFF